MDIYQSSEREQENIPEDNQQENNQSSEERKINSSSQNDIDSIMYKHGLE